MLPHFQNIDDREALQNIEKAIFSHETIYWFPTVATWMLYRSMRDAGVRICFDGEGADGLFGSSPDYITKELEQAVNRLDWRRYLELRGVLRGLVGGNFDIDRATTLGELRWFAKVALTQLQLLDPMRRPVRSSRVQLLRILDGDYASSPHLGRPLVTYPGPRHLSTDPRTIGMSRLETSLFDNFHHGALPMQLTSFDRASMANGIESRMPFLDWRLVAFAFALSNESRNDGGYTKRLRVAMQGLIPDTVRLRTRKMGYISPVDYWARGALKPWLLDLSASRSFLDTGVWDGLTAKAAIERAVHGGGSVGPVWPILNAYVLEQSFKQRARAVSRLLEAKRAPIN